MHLGAQRVLHGIIFLSLHGANGLTVNNNLGATVAGGLQENGIHQHAGLDISRLGLHNLRAPHLCSLLGNKGVQGHILGFKRSNLITILIKHTAKASS